MKLFAIDNGRYVNYIRISYSSKIALIDGTIKVLRGIMGIILYFAFYFGVLFLIIGTALVLFIMAALPKI